MAKLQFQIGSAEYVRVVLPSRQHGNADLLIGKAMVRAPGFNCSPEVMIERSILRRFFEELDAARESLKGTFCLKSTNSRFQLKGCVNRKGAFQVEVACTGLHFTEPENTEWSASVSFACGHLDYEEAASMLKMEGESGRNED
jgi:hypothetical protein